MREKWLQKDPRPRVRSVGRHGPLPRDQPSTHPSLNPSSTAHPLLDSSHTRTIPSSHPPREDEPGLEAGRGRWRPGGDVGSRLGEEGGRVRARAGQQGRRARRGREGGDLSRAPSSPVVRLGTSLAPSLLALANCSKTMPFISSAVDDRLTTVAEPPAAPLHLLARSAVDEHPSAVHRPDLSFSTSFRTLPETPLALLPTGALAPSGLRTDGFASRCAPIKRTDARRLRAYTRRPFVLQPAQRALAASRRLSSEAWESSSSHSPPAPSSPSAAAVRHVAGRRCCCCRCQRSPRLARVVQALLAVIPCVRRR